MTNFIQTIVKGCYFDISKPGTYGSTGLCFAEVELEFPEKTKEETKTEIKEEIKVNYKRKNKLFFIVFLVYLKSK